MKILINSNYFYPGIKSGGNLASIKNLIESFSQTYQFHLITRDRDLGDKKNYDNIVLNKWIKIKNHQIRYVSKNKQTFNEFRKIINQGNYKLIYLNSFFDIFTIKILILNKLLFIKNISIILAPKGELSINALKIKKLKKLIFLFFFKKIFNIYNDVYFLASTVDEKKEIENQNFKNKKLVYVARDIVERKEISYEKATNFKSKNILNLCYISRITPKKNLLLLLDYLSKFKKKYVLHIYGHVDDKKYFLSCQNLINKINKHEVLIKYMGIIKPKNVVNTLNKYHLMILLTKNENFGHIIFESFNAGTPVLISNETIWKDLEKKKIGWNISIENNHEFINKLKYLSNCSKNEYLEMRKNVFNYYNSLINDKSKIANREVIDKIISK